MPFWFHPACEPRCKTSTPTSQVRHFVGSDSDIRFLNIKDEDVNVNVGMVFVDTASQCRRTSNRYVVGRQLQCGTVCPTELTLMPAVNSLGDKIISPLYSSPDVDRVAFFV